MKKIRTVILAVLLGITGCVSPLPGNPLTSQNTPPVQNISSNESIGDITTSPNISYNATPVQNVSQNTAPANVSSANVVWTDTTALPLALESTLFITGFSFRASSFVRFSGNSSLPEGTIVYSQLYDDGKLCLWWPVSLPIKLENSFWTIITPLGVTGSPDTLIPGHDYHLVVYNDSLKAEHHFFVDEGPPAYVANAVSGNLGSDWQKTTISQLETSLGYKLPVPTYLPNRYEIKEIYTRLEPNSTPQITSILLLISDNPIEWKGSTYTTRLALDIGWNEAGLGLKMPWAEPVPEVAGRLERKDRQYILWWPGYGIPQSLGSTLRLYADLYFPKEEMIKIAASTPATPTVAFTVITAPLTLDGTKPGTEIPWGSIVYHWANGITEVYGPDNERIFITKDSAAAHITAPGGGGPATRIYQVPNGASIDSRAMVGNDKATKIYVNGQLILTIIEKTEDFVY